MRVCVYCLGLHSVFLCGRVAAVCTRIFLGGGGGCNLLLTGRTGDSESEGMGHACAAPLIVPYSRHVVGALVHSRVVDARSLMQLLTGVFR